MYKPAPAISFIKGLINAGCAAEEDFLICIRGTDKSNVAFTHFHAGTLAVKMI